LNPFEPHRQARRLDAQTIPDQTTSGGGWRSQSDTCAGWTVSATTPRRSALSASRPTSSRRLRDEALERLRGVVAMAIKAAVDQLLDAQAHWAEQRRHRQRRGRNRET